MTGLTQFIPTPRGNFAGEGELLSLLYGLKIKKELYQSDLSYLLWALFAMSIIGIGLEVSASTTITLNNKVYASATAFIHKREVSNISILRN